MRLRRAWAALAASAGGGGMIRYTDDEIARAIGDYREPAPQPTRLPFEVEPQPAHDDVDDDYDHDDVDDDYYFDDAGNDS